MQRSEQHEKTISKKKIGWAIGGGILLIGIAFLFWWYGAFADLTDLFRSDHVYTPDDLYPEASIHYLFTKDYIDSIKEFEKEVEDLSTEALTKSVVSFVERILTLTYYSYNDYSYRQARLMLPEAMVILSDELETRHNAGRALMKAYKELPIMKDTKFGPIPNVDEIAHLELMLKDSKFQKYMTFWEKNGLTDLAEEKQKEKAAEPEYNRADYNYLLADGTGLITEESDE